MPARGMQKAHPGVPGWAFCHVESGGVLLSHTLPSAVPSALEGLASGFGMRPGVSPPLCTPKQLQAEQSSTQPLVWLGGCSFAVNHTADALSIKFRVWLSPRLISTGQLNQLPG